MSSTDNMKTKLEQIPNSVSGDGKSFVAQLKRFLKGFRDDTEEKIDEIGAGSVEQVFGLHLTEQHDYDSKGASINNIFVEFDNTNVTDYLNAQIWMKNSSENNYQMVGTTSNVTYTIPNVKTGVTYYVKVVACSTHAGTSDFDTAPVAEIEIRGSVLIPAAPTQFYLTWDDQGLLWEWEYIDNGYVDSFELRMDGYAGTWNDNRLDSTQNTYSRVEPPVQSGTAYLFIRNVYGEYSPPATHTFNIVAPRKPANPTLDIGLDGVVITMEALPSGCYGYVLEITDFESHTETFETSNNQFTFFQFSGSVSVRYAFKAVVGNGHGEWSNSVSTTIAGEHIDGGRIKANAVTTAKLAANAVTADKIAANTITSDRLQVRVIDAGGTVITPGAIATNNIQADAITTDKIAANAVTATQIYSGNVDALRIQADNIAAGAIKTAKLDSQAVTADKIKTNTITSDQIAANTITSSRLEVRTTDGQGTVVTPGAVATGNIQAGAITAAKIYSGQVQANLIQASNIATDAITTEKLNAQAVTTAKIAANAITATQIAAGAVTANKLSSTTLSAMFATIGTFQSAAQGQPRVVISDSLIEVYDGNTLRVRLGVWS